tara:strand:- start:1 stop:720 length:720 start_codon:yes stop_codon:yes gene_type:complete
VGLSTQFLTLRKILDFCYKFFVINFPKYATPLCHCTLKSSSHPFIGVKRARVPFLRTELIPHTLKMPFLFPLHYSFPPFFTLQPNETTHSKQLALWRDLILKYHTENKIKTLILHDCPLWRNNDISRQLDRSAVDVVVADFVSSGYGEWEDEATKTRCRILWRKPKDLASDIYDWATTRGFINEVCTLFELHSGEDVEGTSFQGADEELLRRAIGILEDRGQATLFRGETSGEDGVKFL